jgi:hypothetical protein
VFGLVAIKTGARMSEETLQFVLKMPPVTVRFIHVQSYALFS